MEPSEGEKALSEVKAIIRGYTYGDTSNTATCILRDVEALTAYIEKKAV